MARIRNFVTLLLFLTILSSGCVISPNAPWPIGRGGLPERGLGSPEADLGRARAHSRYFGDQLTAQQQAERENGEAWAYYDLKYGLPWNCGYCSEIEYGAYWGVMADYAKRQRRVIQKGKYDMGEAVGEREIMSRGR